MAFENYPKYSWRVETLSNEEFAALPGLTPSSIPDEGVVGLGSSGALKLELHDSPRFYYDFEQWRAGLIEYSKSVTLLQASVDFKIREVQVKAGALVLVISHEDSTSTLLLEDLDARS